MSQTWEDAECQIVALLSLEDDWDGQGAAKPSQLVIVAALRWMVHCQVLGIDPPDRVIAGVNGTVIFEWCEDGHYREDEVVSPGRVESRWACGQAGSRMRDVGSLTGSVERLNEMWRLKTGERFPS